ncbi:MAG: hypothetical protein ALAOOOJD_01134 [bacterium]|nr:hypothetical protein [bacterium]
MKEISPQQLKQYLTQLPPSQLVDDIIDLYKKFNAVKDYYQNRMAPAAGQHLLEKYKAIIQKELFPTRGFGKLRLAVARKAITEYQKVSDSIPDLADLMLFYVEMGVQFTKTYGDINEPFYDSMETMYERVAKFVTKHQLNSQFVPRFDRIVNATSGMGWGFHDALTEIYHEHFGALG